jgi:hypothetical protein
MILVINKSLKSLYQLDTCGCFNIVSNASCFKYIQGKCEQMGSESTIRVCVTLSLSISEDPVPIYKCQQK